MSNQVRRRKAKKLVHLYKDVGKGFDWWTECSVKWVNLPTGQRCVSRRDAKEVTCPGCVPKAMAAVFEGKGETQ
jgi:hypothetical protein